MNSVDTDGEYTSTVESILIKWRTRVKVLAIFKNIVEGDILYLLVHVYILII